jgi:cyclase
MFKRLALLFTVAGTFTLAVYLSNDGSTAEQGDPSIPEMKFNDVKELAPGVFFRYSSISATDPRVPFGGCNNIWVVFKDYVFVVDANFPKEAGDVLADIKKTTKKPIKYVLDTHHHGDHAYGNCIWAKEGAQIIASKPTTRLLKTNGPKQWADASTGPMGRADLKKNELKQADITFEDSYVLDDGSQRVEIYAFGHAHTSGDAVAYLPRQKILCTGDACVNGAFNFMGHSNSGSWIKCLDKMQKLEVRLVCPGHGKVATRDLLGTQKRYFAEMRTTIKKGIEDKKSLEDIVASIDMPWYKDWTGKEAREIKDNIKHVYDELSGKIDYERIGLGPAPLNWNVSPAAVTRAQSSGASAAR